MIDEYLEVADVGEAALCISELSAALEAHDGHAPLVEQLVNKALEGSERQRDLVPLLLGALVEKEQLSAARVEAGWALSLEFAEDLQLDIPKVAGFYGTMLGASALAGALPLSYVVRGTEHLVECGMAASVVGSALQLVAARLPDAAAARAMVGGAAIDATKLLAADASMGEWLERHGIAELGAELGDTDI